ncbi:hypothetical protein AMK59_2724 [Oryctes borbonicus]|uniref:G protein pathway suppressor 2 n=1 Tax=Oryctes borbonicus TaxID=1629725 RepID=A0A0T6BEP6_9SCAR|nr:hypothetical protein AMK59_2724 [Oryctes borbonicus]
MPAAVTETPDSTEQMHKALKAHILRERQRKKQEREAEVEEERLRKEREAREQQDVMTLGETREQISQLETKLIQLKEEKHQLFLQLKKVLNEDDNRRRQLVKESNEMLPLQALPGNLLHQQVFVPQPVVRGPVPQQAFKPAVKRPRSPSPPQSVPVSIYHQAYNYKGPVANATYHSSPQKDEIRRHELHAVLRAKTAQYANQPGFYPVHQELIYYPPHLQSREPARGVYETARPQTYHIDQKTPLEHYTLTPQSSHILHGTTIPITPAQPPKNTGSITAGYPVRNQTQYQPAPAPAAAIYTTQSRPLYQSPSAAMNYPRD